ncbi:hypothetical protein B0H13DRAFT_2320430 [Mycena leptocephala]|nr:hypothetical protein B0H13DRAFT_2320430 [Mycena leptocephala]
MSTILGVIDPALVNLPGGSTNVPEPPTTNGATTSRNGSRLPQASPPGRPRTYSKAEIETWAASNYAPRRDANETRSDYDERLTNISRKNPLLEACNKLKLKVPKNANLDRLRAELSKHWFTSLPNRAPESTQQPAQTVKRRSAIRATDAHDVLASVLAPAGQSFNFSAPAGALPTVSSNARGELRGSIPLVHLAASNTEVPASSSRAAPRPRAKPRPRVTNLSAPSTIVPTTSSTPSTSSLLPSAIPHTPEQTGGPSAHQDAVVNSPLQPTQLKHPDKRTDMYAVLGMQGEEKAGKRGMRTVINPVYSVFIANLKPEMCPLGAFAFYFHYIYDEKKIIDTMELDYTVNKSWRGVRVLHGPKSPTTPFNEQNLYNLYCRAYARAGFKSRLKAHLPRHLLGYRQEAVGVDPLETSKLGWVRGQTYMDTYAPALPKTAILGAAGYQADEVYDPIWRRVRVPPQFLLLVCPMAESMLEKVAGNEHLSGAFHHWEMVIELREYLFQCGAAIWQLVPGSSIFRLPAFQSTDVRNWMSTGYPAELSALQAAAGNPVELERIQNVALVRALTGMNNILSAATNEIRELRAMLERRTAVFTPARGFSAPGSLPAKLDDPSHDPSTLNSSFFSFFSPYPRTAATPRLVSQVQLVLPALAAFYGKGAPIGLVHPVLGMQSARWVEDVFPAIQQPEMCWSVWGPNKTLDQFKNVQEIWEIFANGERIAVNHDGTETHMKPPLKLVEQFFKHKWRTSDSKQAKQNLKKTWERFREIPEWIDRESTTRRTSSEVIIAELEDLRSREDGGEPRGINWLVKELAERRKKAAALQQSSSNSVPDGSSGQPRKRAAAMGSPKLWEIIGPAAETRSLLNLATIEGFRANNRGLRTLVVGVDASIRIHAIVAALQAANVFNPGLGGQKLVLEKLFYQLGNFSLAPLTMVWIFDGTGRPPIKRGTRVIYRPPWLVQHLKTMITAFGFYFYDVSRRNMFKSFLIFGLLIKGQAPGEAEAELAQLNENGEIDGIITEDSDAFLFGAQCVIRTQGPSVQHSSLIFTSESIKNTDAVALDQDGLILCALLLGGDYDSGVTGAGVAVARALAAADFGKDLVTVLKNFRGSDKNYERILLGTLQSVADLYLNPLTSRSPGFTGPHPLAQLWRPAEPSIPQLAVFCSTHFGWNGDQLLKKLNSTLWPAIAFRMISSPYVLCERATNLLVSPITRARILKHFPLAKHNPAFIDSASLELYRVRMSTDNFIQLASLDNLPQTAKADIKLVSIPKVILAVAMRDVALPSTNLTQIPASTNSSDEDEISIDSSDDGSVIDINDSDEEDLARAHRTLMDGGIIDLSVDL